MRSFFSLTEHGTTAGTEVRAGVTTFLTMAYILFVNPQILSQAGLPAEDVAAATALSAAFATLVMGLYARYPFALAPGMGLNAYFVFSVVLGMGVSYRVALAAVFVEGLLFLVLAVAGIRSAVLEAIPRPLKIATTSGIGLFLALIGLQNAGLVADSPATLVTLGAVQSTGVVLALAGLILITVLLVRRVKGALLAGIVVVTLLAWLLGAAPAPERIAALPALPHTLFAFDFSAVLTGDFILVVLAFFFVDFFDTAGTLIGVGRQGGFLDERGTLPRANRAFAADAIGTTVGAILGTSTVTTYIESASGIQEGGRTGLTAVVVAVLFVCSMFFTPVFTAIPALATAPALVVIGMLMMRDLREIDWRSPDAAIPAFLTMVAMPFTYSIANGIALGIVSFVLVKAFSGRYAEVPALMYALAAILVLYYGFLGPA